MNKWVQALNADKYYYFILLHYRQSVFLFGHCQMFQSFEQALMSKKTETDTKSSFQVRLPIIKALSS